MSAIYGILVLLQLLLCQLSIAKESCPALYKRYSPMHTFCLPPNPSCKILDKGVTPQHIKEILHAHNEYRSRVATGKETIGHLPPASDMLQMEWDKELAAVAQKHAEQCKLEHDCTECRQVQNFVVGQNIFFSSTNGKPDINWALAVKSWYNEVSNFDANIIQSLDTMHGDVLHFTQVIWAKSWKVGCGYSAYVHGNQINQLYTCNYGPMGNIYSKDVYKPGQACSKCPKNTCCGSSCGKLLNYKGLCKVTGKHGPYYPPEKGYIYYCDFEPGTKCNISFPASMKWETTRTLFGSYIGVVLKGGEKAMLNITKTFKALPSMCFLITFRKGPNVAGQQINNVAKLHFYDISMPYQMESTIDMNSSRFISFPLTWTTNIAMNMKIALSFEVPRGAPSQYFEVKDILVKSGSC